MDRMREEFTAAFQHHLNLYIKFQMVLSSFFYKLTKIILHYAYIDLIKIVGTTY